MPTPTSSTSNNLPEPPFPTIILLGCQPNLMPPPAVAVGPCRVCGGAIHPDHIRTYCAQCDALAPSGESKARGARIGLKARTQSDAAEAKLKTELRRKAGGVILSEVERRRMWNGGWGTIARELAAAVLGVYGQTYRDYLISIDQAPDWSLILDHRGNVIGRHD